MRLLCVGRQSIRSTSARSTESLGNQNRIGPSAMCRWWALQDSNPTGREETRVIPEGFRTAGIAADKLATKRHRLSRPPPTLASRDPSLRRGRGTRGITRTCTPASFTVRIQAHTVFRRRPLTFTGKWPFGWADLFDLLRIRDLDLQGRKLVKSLRKTPTCTRNAEKGRGQSIYTTNSSYISSSLLFVH